MNQSDQTRLAIRRGLVRAVVASRGGGCRIVGGYSLGLASTMMRPSPYMWAAPLVLLAVAQRATAESDSGSSSSSSNGATYWKISNAGPLTGRPKMTELLMFSDVQCSVALAIDANGGWSSSACPANGCDLCSGHDGSNECRLLVDSDSTTGWQPAGNDGDSFAQGAVWVKIRFSSATAVRCIQLDNLGEGSNGANSWNGGLRAQSSNDGTTWMQLTRDDTASSSFGTSNANTFVVGQAPPYIPVKAAYWKISNAASIGDAAMEELSFYEDSGCTSPITIPANGGWSAATADANCAEADTACAPNCAAVANCELCSGYSVAGADARKCLRALDGATGAASRWRISNDVSTSKKAANGAAAGSVWMKIKFEAPTRVGCITFPDLGQRTFWSTAPDWSGGLRVETSDDGATWNAQPRDDGLSSTRGTANANTFVPKSMCHDGILSGLVCCPNSCGTCGGTGCSARDSSGSGGVGVALHNSCCVGEIEKSLKACTTSIHTGCVVPAPPPPPSPPPVAIATLNSQPLYSGMGTYGLTLLGGATGNLTVASVGDDQRIMVARERLGSFGASDFTVSITLKATDASPFPDTQYSAKTRTLVSPVPWLAPPSSC